MIAGPKNSGKTPAAPLVMATDLLELLRRQMPLCVSPEIASRHLDPDELALLAVQAAAPVDSRLWEHLSGCEDCRQALRLALEIQPEQAPVLLLKPQSERWRPWAALPRWMPVAATLLLVCSAAWLWWSKQTWTAVSQGPARVIGARRALVPLASRRKRPAKMALFNVAPGPLAPRESRPIRMAQVMNHMPMRSGLHAAAGWAAAHAALRPFTLPAAGVAQMSLAQAPLQSWQAPASPRTTAQLAFSDPAAMAPVISLPGRALGFIGNGLRDAASAAAFVRFAPPHPLATFHAPAMAEGLASGGSMRSLAVPAADSGIPAFTPTQWRVVRGVLLSSLGNQNLWQQVAVGHSPITSVAASGNWVWAGDQQGRIWRSHDAGNHWSAMTLVFHGRRLRSPISRISMLDQRTGTLITRSGNHCQTLNGGRSWSCR